MGTPVDNPKTHRKFRVDFTMEWSSGRVRHLRFTESGDVGP